MTRKTRILSAVLIFVISLLIFIPPVLAAAPTTSITITRYAADGTTVLDQTTVSYEWMMDNLPVQGDGVTHYYHQGPTFDFDNEWDPDETVNIDSRDVGAVMGTDVRDLCELLPGGGAVDGDEIEIKSSDGFSKKFAFDDVYNPESAQGKLVVCWYEADYGYVPDYDTGIRLVFMTETPSTEGKYIFGNWDMHETMAEEYWHYYVNYPDYWPSSSGFSVKWINRINIISGGEDRENAGGSPVSTSDSGLKSVGIALDRDSIDFESVSPGDISPVETLNVMNLGNSDINITLQVSTSDSTAHNFYERALYINNYPYETDTVITPVETGQTGRVNIQLRVPEDLGEADPQGTRFIFWAEAGN